MGGETIDGKKTERRFWGREIKAYGKRKKRKKIERTEKGSRLGVEGAERKKKERRFEGNEGWKIWEQVTAWG